MSIWFFYWAGVAVAWVALMTFFVREEFDGDTEDMDYFDWATGAGFTLVIALFWPIVAAGLVPILIVKHSARKDA